jgi:signal transduction histidine kinase
LEQVHKLTTSAVAEMRILLLELRPKAMEQMGLDSLIQQLSQSLQSRRQFELNLEIEQLPSLPLDVKMVYYRITQEALNNIIKHAQATRVDVAIKLDEGHLVLRIQDDGRGFERDSVTPSSFGLNIMRERAEAVGANLSIASEVEHGTQIILSCELDTVEKVG